MIYKHIFPFSRLSSSCLKMSFDAHKFPIPVKPRVLIFTRFQLQWSLVYWLSHTFPIPVKPRVLILTHISNSSEALCTDSHTRFRSQWSLVYWFSHTFPILVKPRVLILTHVSDSSEASCTDSHTRFRLQWSLVHWLFFFRCSCFGVLPKNPLPSPRSWRLPIFSYKNFMVSFWFLKKLFGFCSYV